MHQFTLIAHFYTVSHWKGIYLYFYLVKIQLFDYRIITISWSCLKAIHTPSPIWLNSLFIIRVIRIVWIPGVIKCNIVIIPGHKQYLTWHILIPLAHFTWSILTPSPIRYSLLYLIYIITYSSYLFALLWIVWLPGDPKKAILSSQFWS